MESVTKMATSVSPCPTLSVILGELLPSAQHIAEHFEEGSSTFHRGELRQQAHPERVACRQAAQPCMRHARRRPRARVPPAPARLQSAGLGTHAAPPKTRPANRTISPLTRTQLGAPLRPYVPLRASCDARRTSRDTRRAGPAATRADVATCSSRRPPHGAVVMATEHFEMRLWTPVFSK